MKRVRVNGHELCVFSEEDKKEIKRLFVDEGYSQRKLMIKYGCSQGPMTKVLDELGLDHSRGNITAYKYNYPDGIYSEEEENRVLDEISKVIPKKQKWNINDKYFDDIRNPEVIYTIGFLYADGYNDGHAARLCLEERDGEILEKINQNMSNEKPLIFLDKSNKHDFGYDYENQYALEIYNSRIANVLNILGVVRRKSLILEFPKWLHPSLYNHFLRGVYDGDGSVYRYINKNGKVRNTTVTITSTEQFCKAITDICAKYIGINSNIYEASCKNGITKVFSITGKNICKKFLDWLYKDSTIHLERKYNRYCDYYELSKSNDV